MPRRRTTSYNSQHCPMFVGDQTLTRKTGTLHGCPLGPLGCALAIQSLVERAQKGGGLMWSAWYLGDGNLLGGNGKV